MKSVKNTVVILTLIAGMTLACRTSEPNNTDYTVEVESVNYSVPFSRGVNFSTWFESHSPREIVFSTYTEQDFINAKSLGIDVIRLPIRMHSMTNGAPDYILDPLFLHLLDHAVDWAERHELYLILDNHSFDPVAATASDIDAVLIPVWTQIAERYKNRSEFIVYEILNEPHGIDAVLWGDIQKRVVEAVRKIDSRYIIVGGVDYNSIDKLFELPIYPFDKIIYTFHFYDPYLFTHQGETWGSPPNLLNLRYLPFPAEIRAMPPIPQELRGTWVERSLRYSYSQDATVSALARQLDKVARFSRERGNVPVFCGEFGVFIPNSLQEDRVRWYASVVKLLDERGIAWTSWDYYGGFGVFRSADDISFESGLNVELLNVMGFTPPPQISQEKIINGFSLFDNFTNSHIAGFMHWGSDVNLFYPNGNKFALSWGNAERYGSFGFNFRRKIDWEHLRSQGYAITFKVRADKPARFDVRLINREDADSIPWRMNVSVYIDGDDSWQSIRVPLSSMREQGAWINATQEWRQPAGNFSWTDIVSLIFVAENSDLHGVTIIFDSIEVNRF